MSCSLLADGHSQRHVFVDFELSHVGKVAIRNGLSFYDVGFEELGLGAVFACRTSGQGRKRDHESRKPKHWWHLTFAVRRASVGALRRAKSVALHRGVRPWLVHAAFALVVSRILRGTCRSRAPLSVYTRPRATRPRRAPFRLFVLCARSSAQRQEHSVAIVRTCRRARFGLRRLRSGAATAF